ncbi:MAG: rRNA maturation RNase YbeY [Planctomycetota bacterium]|jgi:probable rRNA maturation factor
MGTAEDPSLRFSDRAGWEDFPELVELTESALTDLVVRAWRQRQGPAGAVVEVVWMRAEEHDRLHERYIADPTPTDVITFPYDDDDLFGEIIVNLDMARAQAKEQGHAMAREVALYVVHGALHLLGLDDASEEQKKEMRAAEHAAMSSD